MPATRRTLRNLSELAEARLTEPDRLAILERVAARYAVAITPALMGSIDTADAHDPIALQFVPDERELDSDPQESKDPIGDDTHSPVAGVVHRYPDRVLLKLVNACAVYCRFCFRREMVGPGRGALSAAALAAAMDHVKVIRLHTRMPVAAPERITPALVRALRTTKATFMVLHVNHSRELNDAARAACGRVVDAGIPMLSQSVLLRGVNDDAATLGELMRALVECRIKPYYLHHADLAPGTAHFRTSIAEGRAVMRALHGHYSGLCQPNYVLDIPGGHGKSPIGPVYLSADGMQITDFKGVQHPYPPRNPD